jgi:hypothetical protein
MNFFQQHIAKLLVQAAATAPVIEKTGTDGTVSLILTSVSVVAAFGALIFAYVQTRQIREQVSRLANTESALTRTETALTKTQSHITDIFTNLGDISTDMERLSASTLAAVGLPEAAATVDTLLPRVQTLVEALSQSLTDRKPFITDFIDQRFASLVTDAERAASGSLEIPVVDLTDLAIELFELADETEKIYTTSFVDTAAFWHTPAAVHYLQANKRLITERNVDITRIFIFDTPQALAESEEEMDKQCAARINVKTVLTENIQGDLKRDMFLLGGRVAAQFEMTSDRRDLLQLRVWYGTVEVDTIKARMERLDEVSDLYVPALTREADSTQEPSNG